MIETEGMITVAEAAKRLDRSIEQVRRYLREGKLKGQRIGNQWFVEEESIKEKRPKKKEFEPLVPPELITEIDRTREEIYARNGIVFDVVELIREHRESE
jgi:excisionase family DNA binding protein